VITSIQEHNEVHGDLDSVIHVSKVFFDLFDHVSKITDIDVRSVITIDSIIEIAKYDSFILKDLFFGQLEHSFAFLEIKISKLIFIIIVNHTITKDSLVLVNPKSNKVSFSLHGLPISRTNSLENLGHIS